MIESAIEGLAGFVDWRPHLAPGEKGWIFIIANDKAQAGIIKNYISGIFHRTRCLKAVIEKETVEALELRNGVNIAVKTCSLREKGCLNRWLVDTYTNDRELAIARIEAKRREVLAALLAV